MDGRREQKKEATRQALLDSALALLAERGYAGTRVEDITVRAHLAKGGFYNYFESKEALLAELIFEAIDVLERDYLSELKPGSSAATDVADTVRLCGGFFDAHPEYQLVLHMARGLLKITRGGKDRLRGAIAEFLRRVVARLASSSESRPLTPDEGLDLVALLMGSVAGYRSFKLTAGLGSPTLVSQRAITAGLIQMIDEMRHPRQA
jgi:AcrR family transcriptional regulator